MTAFFIKKAFFDGWDHLFGLVLLNLGFSCLFALSLLLPSVAASGSTVLVVALGALLALLAAVWFSACVHALTRVADFGALCARDVLVAFKAGFFPGLQYGLMLLFAYAAISAGLPFYLSRGGFFGALAAGLLLWTAVVLVLALQWYLPLHARLGGGFAKNLKKSFILFFDNAAFSLFLFVYNALSLALSVVLAFLAPGAAGVALALADALRLRLYKYDWLETHAGQGRADIPWGELLAEDRELVGKRTLRGMIFPWKE